MANISSSSFVPPAFVSVWGARFAVSSKVGFGKLKLGGATFSVFPEIAGITGIYFTFVVSFFTTFLVRTVFVTVTVCPNENTCTGTAIFCNAA